MKNSIRMTLSAGALVLGLGSFSAALAAPTGAYVNVLGGGDYLTGSKMSSLNYPVSSSSGIALYGNPSPAYDDGAMGYSGRAAFGYFFNQDPLNSWAYGFEAGYNYLSPVKSSASAPLNFGSVSETGTGSSTTTAFAADLDFIISEDISEHVSLLYKLGMGYENMTQKFSTPGIAETNLTATSSTTTNSGLGVSGGLGMKYAFSQHVALQAELDGMKGGTGIGYAQGLVGLGFMF